MQQRKPGHLDTELLDLKGTDTVSVPFPLIGNIREARLYNVLFLFNVTKSSPD